MKVMKIDANQAGRRYALCRDRDFDGQPVGTFGVKAECHNYAAHVRGGIAISWRYCAKGLTLADAQALFAKKLAGKARH